MNIVILDSGYKSYELEKELFKKQGFQLNIHPQYKGERSEKIKFAQNADGILVRHTKIDDEFLSRMKRLKAVVRYGIGYDNIDVKACTRFGVKVANVQGYASHAVSDHALALILSCSRALWNPQKQLLEGFAAPPVADVFELHDKTLGIIGLGRIGSKLAHKCAPLFDSIIASDPYKPTSYFESRKVKKVKLEEVLENSDVISLHCALTPETFHILDESAFNRMKRKPVVVNTSRGATVDEKALLTALKNKIIHSAGLDVFNNEPTTEEQQELIAYPRTFCTGHYAWYSDAAANELQKRAAQNLVDLLKRKEIADGLN